MEVEVFSYSFMAAFLGIFVVFLSLVGLYLLMLLLKVVLKERNESAIPPPAPSPGKTAAIAPDVSMPSAVSAVSREDTTWAIAAAAVFLMQVEDPGPSASVWAPSRSEVTDPWMNQRTFSG